MAYLRRLFDEHRLNSASSVAPRQERQTVRSGLSRPYGDQLLSWLVRDDTLILHVDTYFLTINPRRTFNNTTFLIWSFTQRLDHLPIYNSN